MNSEPGAPSPLTEECNLSSIESFGTNTADPEAVNYSSVNEKRKRPDRTHRKWLRGREEGNATDFGLLLKRWTKNIITIIITMSH